MPGGVVCIRRRGETVLNEAFGTRDGTRPAMVETVYDLASLTKPIATGASLLTLVEQGRITLTATLAEFFDGLADPLAAVTVRHLLTHTSGLPAWIPCYNHGLGHANAVAAILTHANESKITPGLTYAYSCLNFILLHAIIEKVSGTTLDTFARDHIFAPLGLASLMFRPLVLQNANIAPTISREGPDKDTVLLGVVHDGNARGIGGVSGNAGLFGTAHDVAMFGDALLSSALFGAPTTARLLESQIKPEIGFHTLLFFAQGNGYCPAGDLLSPRAVGHSGYTGTLLTLDPAHEVTIALVTNAVFGDGKTNFLTYRRKFLNTVASVL